MIRFTWVTWSWSGTRLIAMIKIILYLWNIKKFRNLILLLLGFNFEVRRAKLQDKLKLSYVRGRRRCGLPHEECRAYDNKAWLAELLSVVCRWRCTFLLSNSHALPVTGSGHMESRLFPNGTTLVIRLIDLTSVLLSVVL